MRVALTRYTEGEFVPAFRTKNISSPEGWPNIVRLALLLPFIINALVVASVVFWFRDNIVVVPEDDDGEEIYSLLSDLDGVYFEVDLSKEISGRFLWIALNDEDAAIARLRV